MSLLQIVVGGMFGSEAKGHVAAQLAARLDQPLVIRTGGPNAGHTVVVGEQTYKLRQLPTAAVSNPDATVAISAGSLIDPAVLEREIIETGISQAGVGDFDPDRLIIDPQATIISPAHKASEEADAGLAGWSTQKGIGAARAARIMRTAQTAGQFYGDHFDQWFHLSSVANVARNHLANRQPVLIEAAQGYGLGLHTKYYPKTTSADCTAIDALADVGLSPWVLGSHLPKVWVVLRPFPIRVAGESGPLRGETSWEELGLPQERTTVTNKVRRVGAWDPVVVAEAIWANGGPGPNVVVALTMMDQVVPAVRGMTKPEHLDQLSATDFRNLHDWVTRIRALGARVEALGTGPDTMVFLDDQCELRDYRSRADSAVHRGGE